MAILYQKREDYFHTIDTPKKAYFLGLLFADGSVTARPSEGNGSMFRVVLSLEQTDKHILETLNEEIFLDSTAHKLYYLPEKRLGRFSKEGKEYIGRPQYALGISCKRLVEDLMSHGCVPNKAPILRFPFKSIPSSLYLHFIRGYFDGDGGITRNVRVRNGRESNDYHASFIAKNRLFAEEMLEILKTLGIEFRYYQRQELSIVGISSRKIIRKFYQIIYPTGCLCLYRKRDAFEEMIRHDEKMEAKGSGFNNVSRERDFFRAELSITGRKYHLGLFKEAEPAAMMVQMFREWLKNETTYGVQSEE